MSILKLLKKLHNVAGSHRVSFHTLHHQVGIAQPLTMRMIVPVVDTILGFVVVVGSAGYKLMADLTSLPALANLMNLVGMQLINQ